VTIQKTSVKENYNSQPHNTKGRLWLWLGLGGIAIVSAAAGGLLAVSLTSQPLMQAKLSPEEVAVFDSDRITGEGLQFSELTRPVNILVMGMSVLSTDTQSPTEVSKHLGYLPQVNSFDGLSDVMLLLRFDPHKKKLVMLSIPRDTSISVEGEDPVKINTFNAKGGPALSAKTVSQLLGGVEIDRYVRINVLGVSKLIEALGGVTVDVPKDMKYQDDSQHLYINLKKGRQHLNGDQALQLLRYRSDGLGDIGRIERQRIVIKALMEQTLNPQTLGRLPKILNVIQSHIDTNLTVEELMTLAGFGMKTNSANVEMLLVPGRSSTRREFEASYWIPDNDAIATMMTQHFDLEPVNTQAFDPSTVKIVIEDSTGSNSTTLQSLMTTLEQSGYANVYVSDSLRDPVSTTQIITQPGDNVTAEAIRTVLGIGEIQVQNAPQFDSHITIVLGNDWLQQQETFNFSY
jgi:polyisoprenyl-teichoic acid--peptidoglycan teichoic acid transferase